jgi:hypothetical protein
MPNDSGNLLLDESEYEALKTESPEVIALVRPFISAKEHLHGQRRWCLWLKDVQPRLLRSSRLLIERIEAVRDYRQASKRETTRKLADVPMLFGEIRQPDTDYILIPRHSSENRRYVPFCCFSPENIVADSCLFVPSATLFHFGILSSAMHMAWMRQVCGRLESRYRYSAKLVYNNFPWPQHPTPKQCAAVEVAAQGVLDARAAFPDSTLADLYDPLTMPPALVKAHAALDRAVDRCYRSHPFPGERQRVEYLFQLYQQLVTPLLAEEKGKGKPN